MRAPWRMHPSIRSAGRSPRLRAEQARDIARGTREVRAWPRAACRAPATAVRIVGSPQLFREMHLAIRAELEQAVEAAGDAGRTAILVGWDGRAHAVIEIGDGIRPGSVAAVAGMQRLGLLPMLITGDNKQVARARSPPSWVSRPRTSSPTSARPARLTRSSGSAGQRSPSRHGRRRRERRRALAQADLGVALGTCTDAAIGAADLTWSAATPAASPTPSSSPALLRRSSGLTSPGPSATTCSRSRSPRSATSSRCSPGSPCRPAPSLSCNSLLLRRFKPCRVTAPVPGQRGGGPET